MKTKLLVLFLFLFSNLQAQIDYFPPLTGDQWDTLSITELGWCDDQLDELLAFLETNGTKAFLVLKDGKIVVEKIFSRYGYEHSPSVEFSRKNHYCHARWNCTGRWFTLHSG